MKQPKKRSVVNIDADVYEKLKTLCASKGLKINWVVENIINEYIKSNS